jgi:TPP-dependent pyruvate/acetoin dehydrogenase alpha subunit
VVVAAWVAGPCLVEACTAQAETHAHTPDQNHYKATTHKSCAVAACIDQADKGCVQHQCLTCAGNSKHCIARADRAVDHCQEEARRSHAAGADMAMPTETERIVACGSNHHLR